MMCVIRFDIYRPMNDGRSSGSGRHVLGAEVGTPAAMVIMFN
jgi:hypothetical protein